jgi:predicted dinucleotide-binding enzyme
VTHPDSTVAIIGTGTIGSTLAAEFAAGGQDFLLAGRDEQAASTIAAGLDQSIRLEMFGDLHEYGALGRVVTRTEALKAI